MNIKRSSKLAKTKLKEITTKIGSGATPRGGKESYKSSGITLIRSLNVYDFNFEYDGLAFIDESQAQKLSNVEVKQNDILLNITGASVARCCVVPNNVLPARVNQHVAIVRINPVLANPYYVYYSINSNQYKKHLLALAQGGATREALTKDTISDFEISLPLLSVQNKIASILSAYDDLIENNTRRIKILESMAQTLYQEWFVKFRFPGYEQVKMIESELGFIPEGWGVNNFNSLISHHIGGGWGKEKVDEKYSVPAYVVRGTDIPSARYINIENCPLRFHTRSNFKSRKVEVGDLIFEVSGGSKGQPVGRTLLVSEALLNAFDENLICASFCKLIRLNKSKILPEIIYLLILAMYDDGRIEKHQVQSTGISNFKFKPFLENEYVAIPPLHIQEKFGNIVIPLFELLHNLGAKNDNLRKTRDLLLPKLISGQIDVKNLDIDTGEIAA